MPWKKKKNPDLHKLCAHEEKVLERKKESNQNNKKYKNLFAAGEIFCLEEKIKFQIWQ